MKPAAILARVMTKRRFRTRPSEPNSAARNLRESERLYLDFLELTPDRFVRLAKSFSSFDEYERWKRDEAPPWYR